MRRTILSENQYEKKFMPSANSSAMNMPRCPPIMPPITMKSAVIAAINIAVLTQLNISSILARNAGPCETHFMPTLAADDCKRTVRFGHTGKIQSARRRGQLHAKSDKCTADNTIEPLLDARLAGKTARDAAGDPRDKAVPHGAHQHEDDAEREKRDRLVIGAGADELRKERYEEQHDFRVQHVGHEALQEQLTHRLLRNGCGALRAGRIRCCARCRVRRRLLREDKPYAEINQVDRADEFD